MSEQQFVRASFSKGAAKMALSILQTAKRPDKALQHGKYFGVSGTTKLHKECLERIMDAPHIQNVLADRPSLEWPSLEQMAAMPEGSLGWCVQKRLEKLGISFLVQESRIPETPTDLEYAIIRAVRLHEIHHTVLGLPITVAGEATATAFYASTDSMPFDIGVMTSWMLRGSYAPDERRLIWDGIGFGIAVGQTIPELFSPRWEEGWERPITDWHKELGLTDLLKESPFKDDFMSIYGISL